MNANNTNTSRPNTHAQATTLLAPVPATSLPQFNTVITKAKQAKAAKAFGKLRTEANARMATLQAAMRSGKGLAVASAEAAQTTLAMAHAADALEAASSAHGAALAVEAGTAHVVRCGTTGQLVAVPTGFHRGSLMAGYIVPNTTEIKLLAGAADVLGTVDMPVANHHTFTVVKGNGAGYSWALNNASGLVHFGSVADVNKLVEAVRALN